MVSGTLVADVTKSALGTPAQQVFDGLSTEEQRLVLSVQQTALLAIVNTSSASEAAVEAVVGLLRESIGDLGCVKALRAARPESSGNPVPFAPAVMLEIVEAWMESLARNHKLLTSRRMMALRTSAVASMPKTNRDTAFSGQTTISELMEVDPTLSTRLEPVGRGCLRDPTTGRVDENKLYDCLRAARQSGDYAHLFVEDDSDSDSENSGAPNAVCTYARFAARTAKRVAAGAVSNAGLRLEECEATHCDSIKMLIDGAGLQPGVIEFCAKLTREEMDVCAIWTLLTLPTLQAQFVVGAPLGPLDHHQSGRMFVDALGKTLGGRACEFLRQALLKVADAHGDSQLRSAVECTVTPEYAGQRVVTALGEKFLACGMLVTPVLVCCGVPILQLAPARMGEVGELGLPTIDVLGFERPASNPIHLAALPVKLAVPADRREKLELSLLLGGLSGLHGKMQSGEYGAIIAGIDSANKQRAGLPLSTHPPPSP